MKLLLSQSNFKHTLILFALTLCFTTFAQEDDYYWVGGTGDWSDYANHWATSSGGNEFYTAEPTEEDNVYFDDASFTADGQKVIVGSHISCLNMTWSDINFNVGIESEDNHTLTVKGSLELHENVSFELNGLLFSPVAGEQYLASDGGSFDVTSITFSLSDGEFYLVDSLSAKSVGFTNIRNPFRSNGHAIHTNTNFSLATAFYEEINLSNSNIYTKNFTVIGLPALDGNLITDGASISIIYPNGSTKINKEAHPNPLVNTYKVKESHYIRDYNPIFYHLTLSSGVDLWIDDEIDGVEFSSLDANGSSDELITIKSTTEGLIAKLIQLEGETEFHNVNFMDIEATGGATFEAYNSLDLGNVSGINFIQTKEQEISFAEIADTWTDDSPITLDASSTSGLDITYEVKTGPASIDGNILTLTDAGIVEVVASQEGNTIYFAAEEVLRSFLGFKKDQSITFQEIPSTDIDDLSIELTASSTSELPITYEVEGPGKLEGNSILLQDLGTITVTASQSGNVHYNAAESITQQFEVAQILGLADELNIRTYPNPTTDEIVIEAHEPVKIYLYNTEGRHLFFSEAKNEQLDISIYPAGIYLLKMGNDGNWSTRRIVKK